MRKKQLQVSIDRLARLKYVKKRIDPSGLYPSGIMDVTTEELESLYRQAGDEIVSNIVDTTGKKRYYTQGELLATIKTRYQKLLKQSGMPESNVVRQELYARAEMDIFENKYIDIGSSGVRPSGVVLQGTCDTIAPYGIGG